jgi:translocation and assembly module TamB
VLENGKLFNGNVSFNLRELSHFSPFVKYALLGNIEGYAKLDIDFAQPNRLQRLALVLQGEHFQWTHLELKEYYLNIVGQIHQLKIEEFEGNLIFKNQKLLWKHYHFLETELNLSPKNKASPYTLQASGELSISSSGQIEKIEENWNLFIRTLEGNALGQSYRLSKSCDLLFMKKNLSFSPIDLKIGPGHLYVNLDSKGQTLQTEVEKFPIDFFSLFDPQFDLKGYFDLNGSFSNLSSAVQGDISGSFYQFSITEYLNMSPFKGVFNFSFNKGYMEGKASLFERKNDQGTLDLKLPLTLHFYPFKLKLNPQDSAFANLIYKGKVNPFIQMVLPQNHLLEGQTEIAFELKGPLVKPSVHGYATLKHGYYENLYLGLILKNITSKLEAQGEKVRLSHFIANDDLDGKVQAMGDVSLNFKKHMPFQLDVDMSKGRVIQFDFLDATFTGDLKLKGNLKEAELKGDLDVLQANITIPNYIGSGLPKLPVTYLYPRDQNCPTASSSLTPFIPIYFDIHLNVANNVTLKGRGLDTTWEGHLDIRGNDKKPHFDGELNNTEGSFVFAGQVLTLEKGHILFDGDLLKNTQINLIGRTLMRNAKILAYLQGPLLGPKLSFRSDPPYSETEILSLLLFNEPLPKLTPFQAVALTHSLSTLSGVYLGPDILDKVRRGIGVDQLTFGSSIAKGNKYDTIQVGKYITRSVLITLNRPLSVGTSPFVITAHIKGGIELQTYFDENELSKILIQWKLSY